MESMATLDDGGGRPILRFERRLAHPREKVWKAVTDPAEMRHWFPATISAELKVGAPMRFSFPGQQPVVESAFDEGEVLEFDPPRIYAFRWTDSVLRFELTPDGDGTRLLFTHTLGGVGTWGDRPSAARNAAGWDACLAQLAAHLEGRPDTVHDTWFEHAERYVDVFGLGDGEVRDTGAGYRLRFERDLVQSPDTVWTTLLDGAPADVGGPPPARAVDGEGALTKVEPPHLLEYTVTQHGDAVGVVRFELNHQQPIGCRLVVTQTLPDTLAGERAPLLAAWQVRLELFFAALHGHERSWPDARAAELTSRYAERLS